MGCCVSSPDKSQNKKIAKDLRKDQSYDLSIKKLLFLGSGGSGKSTLFKQLRTIHGTGFHDKDRNSFRDHIYSQIIDQMKHIVDSIEELREDEPGKFGHLLLSDAGEKAADFINCARNDMDVDEAIADNIDILWRESAVREVFDNRAKLKIEDSSAYFFNEVRRIAIKSYIPTDKDILLVRHRTTGVIEQSFEVENTMFNIFDVGGQRSERKKWIHCFEHVTAVIFVASLSCYDEVMFEDDSTNSMIDSVDLFEEICNLRWFVQTSMILFLNKKDLFAEKIQKVPLSVCFDEYEDGDTYDNCVEYIRGQFKARNETPTQKEIYSHVTCATDKNNVQTVFADVQHIVINDSLKQGGLI